MGPDAQKAQGTSWLHVQERFKRPRRTHKRRRGVLVATPVGNEEAVYVCVSVRGLFQRIVFVSLEKVW